MAEIKSVSTTKALAAGPLETSGSKKVADEYRARQEQFSKLDQAVKKIPENVAHVESTSKKGDEVLTFVSIREMHVTDDAPKLKEQGMKCQRQVNSVINILNESLGKVTVSKDGMDDFIAKSFNGKIEEVHKNGELMRKLEKTYNSNTSEDTDKIIKSLEKVGVDSNAIGVLKYLKKQQQIREDLYEVAKVDAVVSLALRNKISLVGSEDGKLVDKSLQLAQENPNLLTEDPAFSALAHSREQHIISKDVDRKQAVIVGVYGGSHDFSKEVEEWNKNNPNKRIALIEITPAEYVKNFGLELSK